MVKGIHERSTCRDEVRSGMGQIVHQPAEEAWEAQAEKPPFASGPLVPSCRSMTCRVVGVAMTAGMTLALLRATAPAPGSSALWTLGHTSAAYCPDYVPLVRASLDPYRAPVSQETHDEVRRYYEARGFQKVLLRSGRVGPAQGTTPDERLCHVCSNLRTAQQLFGQLPDADMYVNTQDQPYALGSELPTPLPPPLLSYCTTPAHHDISIPLPPLDTSHEAAFLHTMQTLAQSHPWDTKINKAGWRGSSTGGVINETTYLTLPRIRMVNLSLHHPEVLDARLTKCTQCEGDRVGPLLQRLGYGYSTFLSYVDLYKYTLLLDMDGNGWSSRFPQLLSTTAAVLKQETRLHAWFRPLLQPYVHYLPFREDLSDLLPQLENYTHRPMELQRIAAEGREAYVRLLTPSKQLCYMHLLANEYARVQAATGVITGGQGGVRGSKSAKKKKVQMKIERAHLELEDVCPLLRPRGSLFSKLLTQAQEGWAHMRRRTAGTTIP